MRNFNFNIEYVECLQTNENYADIVIGAKWLYTITDENENSFSLEGWSSFDFDVENVETFISFSELTTSDVIQWIESKENMEEMNELCNSELDKIVNPPIIKRQLLN